MIVVFVTVNILTPGNDCGNDLLKHQSESTADIGTRLTLHRKQYDELPDKLPYSQIPFTVTERREERFLNKKGSNEVFK